MQLTTTIDTDREIVTFRYEGVTLSLNRKAAETSPDLIDDWVNSNFEEETHAWLNEVCRTTCKQVFDNWSFILGRF